jgi:recombination protein U
MKSGKRLEANIKASADSQGIFCYRLRDNAGAFSQSNLRFASSNMCDYFLFDKILLCLEAKNHKGKSLPLTCIRDNQYKEMLDKSKHDGVVCGILIYFEELQEAYFLNIKLIEQFINTEERKSIPIEYCADKGIQVDIKHKKVNFTFDLKKLFISLDNSKHI